ncbi:MAG: 3-dehydroquinate synthase [Muribaculaceae bacterium]|nr:3-dehydroquinate synthase [Muribaculaceae bacterium]
MAAYSRIITTENLLPTLEEELEQVSFSSLHVVTDRNVAQSVLPMIEPSLRKRNAKTIVLEGGEEHKDLQVLSGIWEALSNSGATRSSLILNLGGGVITDIGGFAAATFKRGIRYINIPTTVLGTVDASVGGKTAIDFNGLKNEIGAFHNPLKVIISPQPLLSLPERETLSGFAEIVKISLISSVEFYNRALVSDPVSDPERLFSLIEEAVRFKERVTNQDPTEKGLRKILNFGHTAGHAFETWMLRRGTPITHGEAVAHGILVAIILSHLHAGLPSDQIYLYTQNILKQYYHPLPIECKDYDVLLEIMAHDKKNRISGEILFVLLQAIGTPLPDQPVSPTDLRTALDIYRDLTC